MNLFRPDNDLGTINNYYSLVKPLVDQQNANAMFGGQIRGLQNSNYLQGTAIQQIGRETQALQGIATPQYFMNYQEYYPGFGR